MRDCKIDLLVFRIYSPRRICLAQISGAEIAAAPGVAFTFVTKAGVGLSGMTGRGFVLRKVCSVPAPC